MPISLTTAQVIFAAHTRILELAEVVAISSSFNRVKNQIKIGEALIRYIRVLNTDTTLTFEEEQAICQHMIHIGDLYDFPASPTITSNNQYSFGISTGLQGPQGDAGRDGGATDFSRIGATTGTTSIDIFPLTYAYAARWDYLIIGVGGQRSGSIIGTWTSDGLSYNWYETSTIDIIGDTTPINLTVSISGGNVILNAVVASGTWTITGSRYLIPNNGLGTGPVNAALAEGKIFIGNSSSVATAQTMSGDVTLATNGTASISPGAIVNADISAIAAINVSKLAALTASKLTGTDASGILTTLLPTTTEANYLSGVTSNIQTQLDSKLSGGSGAISTVISSDLTALRAVVSDGSGKIAAHGTATPTHLTYISTLSSDAQTQLNGKLNLTGGTLTGGLTLGGGASLFGSNGSAIVLAENGGVAQIGGGIRTHEGSDPTKGTYWKVIIKEIGDWNMNVSPFATVTHGISDFTKIRSVTAIIRNDANTLHHPYFIFDGINSTIVTLATSAPFNADANYNATSYNRGWIKITYEV